MGYGTRTNSLKGSRYRGRSSKRKSNATAKIRYKPPTARNQRSQILRNARLASSALRLARRHKVYTDWQYSDGSVVDQTGAWQVFQLTDFFQWNSVLRHDTAVATTASHTWIRNLQLNMRYSLAGAMSSVVSVFIVTPQRNYAQRDPFANAPIAPSEFIEPQVLNLHYNVRLNPAIFKVHHAKYFTLTQSGLDQIPGADVFPDGNPFTTYRKWQVNIPVKMSVTLPAFTAGGLTYWKEVTNAMLPYYHRYYIMIYSNTVQGVTPGADAPMFTFDQLATCINSD